MDSLLIEPLSLEKKDDQIIRACHVIRLNNGKEVNRNKLWFQFASHIQPSNAEDCDSYILCLLMDAMTEGRAVTVNGSVSKSLLSNLTEYQRAWHMWRPDLYTVVDIEVKELRKDIAKVDGAVCAFSGGADSMFTVWQHTQKQNSYRTQNIKLCSLIHGFDIPLTDTAAFNAVFNRSSRVLADINIPLEAIKTNYREITKANWGFAHASALIGVLANFKQQVGISLIGSSYPYSYLHIPWGSSPITDHLLASEQFHVIHDGASYTRTEKINAFANWQVGVNNLRVCWEGDIKDKNCGRCEKCIRTQFNFIACGHAIPHCFPENNNLIAALKKITPKHSGILSDWQQIYDYASAHGINERWLAEVKKLIRRGQPRIFSFSRYGYIRVKLRALRKKKKVKVTV